MKKDLKYYMELRYPITITKEVEDGEVYYAAELPDLPGCGAQGKTVEEALARLEEAKELWIETSIEKAMEIPEPASGEEFSGKILLRIPPRLHMKLTLKARKEEASLNQFIRKTLEQCLTLEVIQEELKIMKQKIEELQRRPSFAAGDIALLTKPPEVSIWDTSDQPIIDLEQFVNATHTRPIS